MPLSAPNIPSLPATRPDTPVPFGVEALSGTTRSPYQPPKPDEVALDPDAVRERGKAKLAIVPTSDPKKLNETGWGVIFAKGADTAILDALKPLLDWRKQQVNDDQLFQIFADKKGVKPGESAATWLSNRGVGLAPVDPVNGVPYYLLLVGSPAEIPFEFQYTLDTQWCVGRLKFEKPEDYATYANNVVAYEKATQLNHGKQTAIWMPANGDLATNLLCNDVGLQFFNGPLGKKQAFALNASFAADATKRKLGEILDGTALGKPPALLFTGSHGLEMPLNDPATQKRLQGALVTQEWKPNHAVGEDARFSAEDLPANLHLNGMMHFLFACFGGGCPSNDNYPSGPTLGAKIANEPLLAKLPCELLLRGAQAVVAHVDRAWSYSFQTGSGLPQNQLMRSVLDALMLGLPVGLAADFLDLQWGTLAAQLGLIAGPTAIGGPAPANLANLVIARDDARNYIVLGDPATRLRVDLM